MKHRWLIVSFCLFACGDEASTSKEDLADALDATRQSQAALCATTDRCYPEIMEPDSCRIGNVQFSFGIERDWPAKETDRCWEPMFEKHGEQVLSYLTCLQNAKAEFEACLSSCPTSADELEECGSLSDGQKACNADLTKISLADVHAFEECTDSLEKARK